MGGADGGGRVGGWMDGWAADGGCVGILGEVSGSWWNLSNRISSFSSNSFTMEAEIEALSVLGGDVLLCCSLVRSRVASLLDCVCLQSYRNVVQCSGV